jgi:hypothetical protein
MVRQALQAIWSGSAAVQAVVGRATDVVRRRAVFGDETPLPIGLFEVLSLDENDGIVEVLVTGVSDGGAADDVPRTLLRAMIDACTQPAFTAQGLDMILLSETRESADRGFPDGPQALNRDGQPMLHQADATLRLLLAD